MIEAARGPARTGAGSRGGSHLQGPPRRPRRRAPSWGGSRSFSGCGLGGRGPAGRRHRCRRRPVRRGRRGDASHGVGRRRWARSRQRRRRRRAAGHERAGDLGGRGCRKCISPGVRRTAFDSSTGRLRSTRDRWRRRTCSANASRTTRSPTSSPTSTTSAWSTADTLLDWDSIVFRGDVEQREFIAFWLADGRVVAGMSVNVWDVADPIAALVRSKRAVDVRQLKDPEMDLATLGGGVSPRP